MIKNKQQLLSPGNYIRTKARKLPLGKCYINPTWREIGDAMIIVTRDHINGNVSFGVFVVDLYCLGVIESYWRFNMTPAEFKEFLDIQLEDPKIETRITATKYTLVHNIIYGAVAYAEELGFNPHKSFELTQYLLEEDDDSIKLLDIEFGFKGKPLYVSSPENPGGRNRVMTQLDKTIGRDNYYFITEEEADDFFEKESQNDLEKIDYHDPVYKKNLISQFLENIKIPKKHISKNLDKVAAMIDGAELIFFEYMVTKEEVSAATNAIVGLFDFNISNENFSDDILFGNAAPRKNTNEVRIKAELLLKMILEDKITEGISESNRLIDLYQDIPVFHYLYVVLLEKKTEGPVSLPTYQYYSDKFPGYLPFACKLAINNIAEKQDHVSDETFNSLFLKNYYPGKTTFCRQEVYLYTKILALKFKARGENLMFDVLNLFMAEHHPGIIPAFEIFLSKYLKVPMVLEWCVAWLKDQAKPAEHK